LSGLSARRPHEELVDDLGNVAGVLVETAHIDPASIETSLIAIIVFVASACNAANI
jgi:hypothetical protein